MGAGGLALGGVFLWLALRAVDTAAMGQALRDLQMHYVLLACALYWLGLAFRVGRWHALLSQLAPVAVRAVAETLVVGYAVNNVLPARLGELFRADYAKRRFGLSRAAVLGSIVIERAADLAAILCCLALGLGISDLDGGAGQIDFGRLLQVSSLVIALLIALLLALRASGHLRVGLPPVALRLLRDLGDGLRSLNRGTLQRTVLLTAAVWLAEVAALWSMLSALGLSLTTAEAMLVLSAASLSTLIPTAPGYLGTYQLVFSAALPALGLSATLGVLGSVLIQVCLFGSVTLAGLVLYLARSMHNMRPVRNEALPSGTEYRPR